MKFLTYIKENEKEPDFGFKYDDLIINIRKAAEWIHQDKSDDKFLIITKDLITTLGNWDHYYPKLKEIFDYRTEILSKKFGTIKN